MYVVVICVLILYYHFSYREQMAKEMSEILSRLVQYNLGK